MTTIDQIIAEKLGAIYITEWPIGNFILCVIAMLSSVILCGAIGFERERKGRNAGLRTHLLVGMGSCLIMIISIYGFPMLEPSEFFKRDVARLAAAVVTGVGFLGAGAIIHRNSGIKGLTTAATIWIVMAIGMACGSMNFVLATSATFLIMLVLVFFKKIETKVYKSSPLIKIIATGETPLMSKILHTSEKSNCAPKGLEIDLLDNGEVEIIFYAVSTNKDFNPVELVAKLEALDGVNQVLVVNKRVQ